MEFRRQAEPGIPGLIHLPAPSDLGSGYLTA